jgi:hypothetical protein
MLVYIYIFTIASGLLNKIRKFLEFVSHKEYSEITEENSNCRLYRKLPNK